MKSAQPGDGHVPEEDDDMSPPAVPPGAETPL